MTIAVKNNRLFFTGAAFANDCCCDTYCRTDNFNVRRCVTVGRGVSPGGIEPNKTVVPAGLPCVCCTQPRPLTEYSESSSTNQCCREVTSNGYITRSRYNWPSTVNLSISGTPADDWLNGTYVLQTAASMTNAQYALFESVFGLQFAPRQNNTTYWGYVFDVGAAVSCRTNANFGGQLSCGNPYDIRGDVRLEFRPLATTFKFRGQARARWPGFCGETCSSSVQFGPKFSFSGGGGVLFFENTFYSGTDFETVGARNFMCGNSADTNAEIQFWNVTGSYETLVGLDPRAINPPAWVGGNLAQPQDIGNPVWFGGNMEISLP